MSEMQAMTSASHGCGSMSFSLAVPMSVYIAAARCPPRSVPARSQDFRPNAAERSLRCERSAELLLRQTRPSSRNRVKPGLLIDAEN